MSTRLMAPTRSPLRRVSVTAQNFEQEPSIKFIKNWITRNKRPIPRPKRTSIVENHGIEIDMEKIQAEKDAVYQLGHLAPSMQRFWQVILFQSPNERYGPDFPRVVFLFVEVGRIFASVSTARSYCAETTKLGRCYSCKTEPREIGACTCNRIW